MHFALHYLIKTFNECVLLCLYFRSEVSVTWQCGQGSGHSPPRWISLQRLHLCALWHWIQADEGWTNTNQSVQSLADIFFSNPVFTVRMGKSWRVSPPCAKEMESGTSLCQNVTVGSQKCLIQPHELLIISCFIVVFPCFSFSPVQLLTVENPNLYWMEAWSFCPAFRISTNLWSRIIVTNRFTLSLGALMVRLLHILINSIHSSLNPKYS